MLFYSQEKNWEICEAIKGRIDQFKRTMPLVRDLKNPAMRERHWTQIKTEVQKTFEHSGTQISSSLHIAFRWFFESVL